VTPIRRRFFWALFASAIASAFVAVIVLAVLVRRFGGATVTGPLGRTIVTRPGFAAIRADRGFLFALLVAAGVGAVVAALLATGLSERLVRPLRQLSDASRRVAAGEPAQVPVDGTDEVAQLASSFNLMSGQLARARESERGFLLSVSHELKTPLTAIRGYGEALRDGAATAEEAGPVIERESDRLQRLVQDLLDLARLDQRRFTIRSETVDLGDVARTVEESLRPRAREFGVQLSVDARTVLGAPFVVADRDRTIQVVSNLVENALRATPAGGSVTIRADASGIAVQDTGPGLTLDDQAHAFDRFFLYRRYGGERAVGSGLGLAIVKELAAAMGGTVTVASQPGAGATFMVRLPRSPVRPDVPVG
jgi:signal transduction histidine kinase